MQVYIQSNSINSHLAIITLNLNLQLYFAKKFLQLDLLVDVHSNRKAASKALRCNPDAYSLVFISFSDLVKSGDLKNSLYQIVNPRYARPSNDEIDASNDENDQDTDDLDSWDPSIFSTNISLVVYGDVGAGDVSDVEDCDSTDVSEDSNSDDDEEVYNLISSFTNR